MSNHAMRLAGFLALAAWLGWAAPSRADEGGAGFWLPGQYGSFAAVAPDPGWSLPMFYYHYSGSAGRNVTLPRGTTLTTGLNGSFDGLFLVPTYAPDTTILGARPSFSLAFAPANSSASAHIGLGSLSASSSDSIFGGSDLFPTASLYWNAGVHNFMAYITGNIPIGTYNPNRLSNIGLGHGSVDTGGAYTYLNAATGTEFSATFGITMNLKNPSTNYTNGIDSHLDLGFAQFLTERFFIGAVGFYYQQLTADKGQAGFLGPFEGRDRGIGPQIGYNVDLGNRLVMYTNLRGYHEFDVQKRVRGYGIFATMSLPLQAIFDGR